MGGKTVEVTGEARGVRWGIIRAVLRWRARSCGGVVRGVGEVRRRVIGEVGVWWEGRRIL